ncbi:peptidyl-prolyl cis-trans isomerase [bacterium]|nr:peptidyl-prolyl cis-trans isomerase [bacterium]
MSAATPIFQYSLNAGRALIALAGLSIALIGSDLDFKSIAATDNVLVSVNQQPITVQQLNFAAQRLTGSSADTLDTEQKNTIVNLLIDEELLLQRAELLSIASADPGIRKALARAVISRTVIEFLDRPIDEQQLHTFYLEHRALFSQPLRLELQAYQFEHLEQAQQAFASAEIPAEQRSLLPASALPAHMLRRYLGNPLADIALTLAPGETSMPIQRPDGVYLLHLTAKQPERLSPLTEVRPQVEAEYRRRGRDMALQTRLVTLRQQAQITVDRDQLLGVIYE